MAFITLATLSVIFCLAHANNSSEYCNVLKHYDALKTSMDNYFATREEDCESGVRSDCQSILKEFPEAMDGVYRVKPTDGKGSFPVFCDMSQHGGGWLVIQNRRNGSEDFYRTWFEYMHGFGNLTDEFWLGNEKIHRLTQQKTYELRIDLENTARSRIFAKYDSFRLGDMSTFYTLSVGKYSGTAGDMMTPHKNQRFSAKNLDLDTKKDGNCARLMAGAWWYTACASASLNGAYTNKYDVYWKTFRNPKIRYTSMKIRPLQ